MGEARSRFRSISLVVLVVAMVLVTLAPLGVDSTPSDPLLAAYYNTISQTMLRTNVSEVLLLQSPGIVIDPTRFDPSQWKYQVFLSRSPGVLMFQLANVAPVSRLNFVARMSLSDLWQQFFREYQWIDATWEANMCSLLRLYPSIEDMISTRLALLLQYDAINEAKFGAFRGCLAALTPAAVCTATKALVDVRLRQLWSQYLVVKRREKARLAAILQQRAANLDTQLADHRRTFEANKVPELGVETRFLPFYATTMSPSNWWYWFTSIGSTEPDTSFKPVQVTLSNSQSPNAGWQALDGDNAMASLTTRLAQAGTNVRISMELARVEIARPWLNISVVSMSPIAMNTVPVGGWSSGMLGLANEGLMPLFPTSFIVARKIQILADSWSTDPMQVLAAEPATAQDNPEIPGVIPPGTPQDMIGPLSINGNFWKFVHGSSTDAGAYYAIPGGVQLPGAQIVSWVCQPVPLFPNTNLTDRNNVTRCTASYPIPIVTPDPTIIVPTPTPTPTPTPSATTTPSPSPSSGGNPSPPGSGGSGTGTTPPPPPGSGGTTGGGSTPPPPPGGGTGGETISPSSVLVPIPIPPIGPTSYDVVISVDSSPRSVVGPWAITIVCAMIMVMTLDHLWL